MVAKENFAIGLMSGTSLDGLDMVYARFEFNDDGWSFEILDTQEVIYEASIVKKLAQAHLLSGLDLCLLDLELGKLFAGHCERFIQRTNKKVDFIGSHGHTVFHQPKLGLSKQIGLGSIIAARTNTTVINDFRVLDLAYGGEGAPLVPIGDELLFADYDYCLNLGGIANISFKSHNTRLAYDICPANQVLNYLSSQMHKPYDEDGRMARSGHLDRNMFKALNALNYYQQQAPKSLGREWVEKNIMNLLIGSTAKTADLLCTFTHHIAYQIAQCLDVKESKSMLITGGGAFNTFLIDLIREYSPSNLKITIPSRALITSKEALIFAFLACLRVNNQINCLSSVTGAYQDSSTGTIITP